MKKAIAILLVLFCLMPAFSVVTESNRQEIYPVDSPVYDAMEYLYISTGLALPSTTGPWSAAELDMMLKRIDVSKLDQSEKAVYDYIASELGHSPRLNPDDIFGLDIGMEVRGDFHVHTNKDDFTNPDLWANWGKFGDWNIPEPLLAFPLETWIGNNIYGYSSFSFGVNRSLLSLCDGTDNLTKEVIYNPSYYTTNILFVPPTQMSDLNLNIPYRAFGSIGGPWWNISIGRDKLSWGPGVSGNLTVGDQVPYHNNARFTAFSNSFKYTFSMSSFLHPNNYIGDKIYDEYGNVIEEVPEHFFDPYFSMTEKRTGLKMFIAHRLEWRIINKINMALTESIMYQSDNGEFDFMVLSPTAIFHNYYIRSNANSLLSFEIDYTPIDHLNIYGAVVIDEFRLPGEFDINKAGPPSAAGYQLGAKTSWAVGKGMFYASLEGVYTDPWLYLRDDGETYGSKEYGINFIVANPEFANSGRANYDLDFLGYRYGNDAIVANLNAGYKVYGSWYVDGTIMYMAHGCYDMFTRWKEVVPGSAEDPSAPSSNPPSSGSFLRNPSTKNAVSHTILLSLQGGITLYEDLNFYAKADFVNIINYENLKGQNASDFQFSIGVSYYI